MYIQTELGMMEVFYMDGHMIEDFKARHPDSEYDQIEEVGWYYWPCLPGCLPDGEAEGPFETYDKAVNAIKEEEYEYLS